MVEWKKPLFIGIGWGLGTAAGLAAVLGVAFWYQSRPNPPRPWNTSSIKAQYDYVDTEGDKNTVVFYYVLENTTDFDYRIEDGQNVTMSAKLRREDELSPFSGWQKIDYPLFVPAKKRVRFPIHIEYPCPVKASDASDADEHLKHREAVEKYVANEFPNLNGFDLLDQTNRYEIVFPAGWKSSK